MVQKGVARRRFTRNGHDWTDRSSRLVSCAAGLLCRSAILDGEIVVQDENGGSNFLALTRDEAGAAQAGAAL